MNNQNDPFRSVLILAILAIIGALCIVQHINSAERAEKRRSAELRAKYGN